MELGISKETSVSITVDTSIPLVIVSALEL